MTHLVWQRILERAAGVTALGLGLGGAGLLGAGCSVITAGAFDEREEPLVCGNDLPYPVDLRLELTGMNAHQDHLTVADLVQIRELAGVRTRRLVARTVYDPLGAANLELALPCTVGEGTHEVDLWADFNNDGVLNACPAVPACDDHQWRLAVGSDGTLSYQHDFDFVDLATDAPLPRGVLPITLRFRNMEAFEGMMMEVHVRTRGTDVPETVLVYRRQSIPFSAGGFEVLQPGLAGAGERFDVAIWIDENRNGIYDAPSGQGIEGRDYATEIEALAELGGVIVNLDGNALPPEFDIGIEP
jgi:hypothetical protein